GWNYLMFFRPDLKYLFHKRHIICAFKIFPNILFEYRWSEWPETLALFDFRIEQCFRITPAGISNDRPVAKCARTKFCSALKPADDTTIYQAADHFLHQCIIFQLLIANTLTIKISGNFIIVEFYTGIWPWYIW